MEMEAEEEGRERKEEIRAEGRGQKEESMQSSPVAHCPEWSCTGAAITYSVISCVREKIISIPPVPMY